MRILSLSGGGFQDFYTSLCLCRYEEMNGPLSGDFDLFVGTSAGSMLAAAAALGMPMSEVSEVFRKEGARIFSDRPAPSGAAALARDVARYVAKSKYDGNRLKSVISGFCGDIRMGDVPSNLLIPAVRLMDGEPVLFSNLSHPDLKLSDAVIASAAAPMIFPAHAIDGELYADGAIFSNTPDVLAIDHAVHALGADVDEVSMLSFGAMSSSPPLREPESPNMGILGWLQENRIFRTIISSQMRMAERMARNALGDRYFRIDADPDFPGKSKVGLDVADASAIAAAREAALSSYPLIDEIALKNRLSASFPSP